MSARSITGPSPVLQSYEIGLATTATIRRSAAGRGGLALAHASSISGPTGRN
jgi:hypothetical protein